MDNHNATKPELRDARYRALVAELKSLIAQGRLDEAELLIRQDWRRPVLRSNSRCKYIHGRGWIPRY